ncbi:RNA polymerase sigma factor SigM [compost metagenome]
MLLMILSTLEDDEDITFLTELYEQYYPIMKRKAYEILQDNTIVDDMIQEAFVRLIDKIPTLRSLEPPKLVSYLVHTIHNITINYAEQRKRQWIKTSLGMTEERIEQIADKAPSIEEMYNLKEDYEAIGKILHELSERDQMLLYNKYILELNDKELAALMDIQAMNVRSYLTRARRRAMKLLLNYNTPVE